MQNNPKRAAATLALALVVAAAAGCGSDSDSEPAAAAATAATVRDGDPDIWSRIENGTDCTTLNADFDQAMDNAEARQPGDRLRTLSLDYAAAAEQRMRDLGCYG